MRKVKKVEDSSRIKAVAIMDIFVALAILAVGVFVLLFGTYWADYVNVVLSLQGGMQSGVSFKWLGYTIWIIYFIGLTTIIYAVKRVVDDIFKMVVKIS